MKRYVLADEQPVSKGNYSITLSNENSYYWIAKFDIFSKVLGEAVCNKPILLDSFEKDYKDQGEYNSDCNYWRIFKELDVNDDNGYCEVFLPAGTPFKLTDAGGSGDEIDIFIASAKGGPIVTIEYKDLVEYTITVFTNELGDKIGDLIKRQNPDADFELTKLRQYCSLLVDVEKLFGVDIF